MIKYTIISHKKYCKLCFEKQREKPYFFEDGGKKVWLVNDKYHREDGPALEYTDGDKFWFLNGHEYSFEEWCNKLNKSDEEKVFLRLKYT